MSYDGDADKIIPDLPKLLNECAGVRSDSEAGLMGLAADEIERLRAELDVWKRGPTSHQTPVPLVVSEHILKEL